MRAREFIFEHDKSPSAKDLPKSQQQALKGMLSLPAVSHNTSNGSPYTQYRFGLALAGAPDYPTKESGAFAGDPLISTYTDAELEIVNAAAKMVGAGPVKRLTKNRSEELSNTNTTSPVAQWQKGTKKK